VTYPLDLVRTRLAYDVEGRAPPAGGAGGGAGARAGARRGIAGVLAATVRSEGLGGLYRGIGPTLLGILPYAGLKFYVYQSLKAEYRRRAPARARARPGPRVHSDASVLRGLGCGGSCWHWCSSHAERRACRLTGAASRAFRSRGACRRW